ncbi:hypothetical protein K469DRAFT_725304 [Zopfia rhizophila CBS 207.26]|uniref:Uncharacterized protein n=1 Tax=Zopfia rhizophila CBS 207.26 TaxID=1314779 RepID=A0A6A6D9S9_9PEZI|nr:hypothetical protein K469DRAFT_725304 [Zopfia rhizophila CBS 207.26]
MRCSLILTLVAFLSTSVLADLHASGLCVDNISGKSVYNADATTQACTSYLNRNTGSKQWDTCPDCQVSTVGGLTFCHSEAWHIGGDELSYYCKQAGADGSLAD